MDGDAERPHDLVINEVQLILAEKRTSLASLRTAIAVFALPISALSVLIATSRYYDLAKVLPLLLPLLGLSLAMMVLGSYLLIQSLRRIHHHDRLISMIKKKHSRIAEFLD